MEKTDANLSHPYVQLTTSTISLTNRWDHFLARVGYKRSKHRVEPGLYRLGNPTMDSPVFTSCNYTLSFDDLRSALAGIDCYIFVLNTQGINVWCSAGKAAEKVKKKESGEGTFSTDELVHRIEVASLQDVVRHRVIILPQLSAPGVCVHEVRKRTGFKVEFGPVLAADLPEYLKTRRATPEMRRIRFPLRDRLTLIPIELVGSFPIMLIGAAVLFFLSGFMASMAAIAAILAGVVLFPILLPWIPTQDFSSKGFILGGLVAIPFARMSFLSNQNSMLWLKVGGVLPYLLTMPSVTAFIALNFTGATTFTSKTGVKREIYTYFPFMAWMFVIGIVLAIMLSLI